MISIKAQGVSRMVDSDKALLLCLNRKPTDDEVRIIHDLLSGVGGGAVKELHFKQLSDWSGHVYSQKESAEVAARHCDEFRNLAYALNTQLELLNATINTPQTEDFFMAVRAEAARQQQRWGSENDAGKEPMDWFWLLGWLSGKAVKAFLEVDPAKGFHHIISSAAVLLNWHRHVTGEARLMRPGILPPEQLG